MKNILFYFNEKRKKITAVGIFAFISLICLTLLFCGFVPLEGEKELYTDIIRFHVLANSDSDQDQALKLSVRDEVTRLCQSLLSDCKSINEAKTVISERRADILECAKSVITESGYDYELRLLEGEEIYPRRVYGRYVFPSGEYYSVRLSIGSGTGKNWWCVLFPPMCLGGAVVEKYEDEEALKSVLSDNEIDIIKEDGSVRREIRFFILDFLNGTLKSS